MANRYKNKTIFRNQDESYDSVFEERHVPYIRQYGTSRLTMPTIKQLRTLSKVNHVWKTGDRFYKLATHYYQNPRYWWVIALYNKRPTEADVRVGDVLMVPLPIEHVLRVMRA
tara:strand:- start:750 stop:1088 length:339 start_codon:yes stop_codon:yes gene_type:complete